MSTQHLYFDVIVAHLAIGVIKVSVICCYKRIFTTSKFHHWANVIMVFAIPWTLGATIVGCHRQNKATQTSSLLSLDADILSLANFQLVDEASWV